MIKQRITAWFKNEFIQNVLVLFSGSAIAQGIPVLAMIVLTRLYPEEVFGIFFVYASAGIVLYILATLKLELAIVLPKTNEEAMQLYNISVLTCLVISMFSFLLVYIFGNFIARVLAEKSIGEWIYLLPASMFFAGVFQSSVFWYNRQKKYKIISAGRITKALVMSGIQIIAAIAGIINGGLIFGLLAGQLVSAMYLFILVKLENKTLSTNLGPLDFRKHVKSYLKIPVFNTVMGVFNNLSNQLPVFLLTRFYGLQVVGLYGLANRIVSVPMGLVGQSVGQVFYQQAAQTMYNEQSLKSLVRSTYIKLFKFAVIPFVLLFIFSPFLFKVFFGEAWVTSGVYTRILIPWLFIMFLNSPITYIITILKKQQVMVFYEILLLLCRFLALYAGYKLYGSVIISIIFFSSVGVVFNLFLLLFHLKIAGKTDSGNE